MSAPDFEQDDEQIRETAGERTAHYFRGTKLLPYSFARRCALQRMIYEGCSTFELYALLVFICMKTEDELDNVRSDEQRKKFRKERDAWADTHGPDFETQVQKVGNEILIEHQSSDFKFNLTADQKEKGVHPNESGRAPQSNTSRKSRRSSKAA
jgi:hypothetical protein